MIVVISFYTKEVPFVEKTLDWLLELDGKKSQFDCLLTSERGTPTAAVIERAKKYFKQVYHAEYSKPPIPRWPMSANHAFQKTLNVLKPFNRPFLWLEPDAIPIKKGWAEELWNDYQRVGKPFYGHIVNKLLHCNGVAIYPARPERHCPELMTCTGIPWDIQMKKKTIHLTHRANDKIMHLWNLGFHGNPIDGDGLPVTFPDFDSVEDLIDLNACIVHRNKDGTLIDRLREGKPMHRTFLSLMRKEKKKEPCFVMLGRYGDIMNILPVVRRVRNMGKNPFLMVSKDYSDILDGVGYANKEIWNGDFADLKCAKEVAEKKFRRVIVPQVYGKDYEVKRITKSFTEEQWRMCGMTEEYGKDALIFDKRDLKAELALWNKVNKTDKPTILVNTSGVSSPYLYYYELMAQLAKKWDSCEIIDLRDVKANRIYDLLGLYDRAQVLITTDTSTLHLANASPIKTIALISEKPTKWHGSKPVCNCIQQLTYSQSETMPQLIHTAIERAMTEYHESDRLVHVYSDFSPLNQDTIRRMEVARKTWWIQYRKGNWAQAPLRDETLPRLFSDNGRKLPFIKDLIGEALALYPNATVVLTNSDTCLADSCGKRIREALIESEAVYSFRRDFVRLEGPLKDWEVEKGDLYQGCDLFAFKASWWEKHKEEYPDMVLGAETWDWCLRELMNRHNGKSLPDTIFHERHSSTWEHSPNRLNLPSNMHNRKLAKEYLAKIGVDTKGIL